MQLLEAIDLLRAKARPQRDKFRAQREVEMTFVMVV